MSIIRQKNPIGIGIEEKKKNFPRIKQVINFLVFFFLRDIYTIFPVGKRSCGKPVGNKEEVPYLANDSLQDQSLFLCNVLTEWLTTSSSTSATSGLRRRYPPWQSSWRPWVISRMNPRLKSNRLKAYYEWIQRKVIMSSIFS